MAGRKPSRYARRTYTGTVAGSERIGNANRTGSSSSVDYASSRRYSEIKRKSISELNIKMLIIGLIAGGAVWFAEQFVYNNYIGTLGRPVLIGTIFAIFALLMGLVIGIVSILDGTNEKSVSGQGTLADMLIMLGLVVLIFGAGFLFQWIYEKGINRKEIAPTSYIFVIDNSGSMEENDPYMERYSAIDEVMKTMDDNFPFMIYGFNTDVQVMRPMERKQVNIKVKGFNDGGTDIKYALEKVLDDYQSGNWNGGAHPRVILLSDGNSSGPYRSVLGEYVQEKISISTVRLGNSRAALMKRMAKQTGGIHIEVNDVKLLSQAMADASIMNSGNDLLSARIGAENNVLYGVLRVVLLTILGVIIGAVKTAAYGDVDSAAMMFISSACGALVGALAVEIATSFGVSHTIPWLALWILTAVPVCNRTVMRATQNSNSIATRY